MAMEDISTNTVPKSGMSLHKYPDKAVGLGAQFILDEQETDSKTDSEETTPLLPSGDVGFPLDGEPKQYTPMIKRPFKEQLFSFDYFSYVVYTGLSSIFMNIYIGTVPFQIERLATERTTGMLLQLNFSVLDTVVSGFVCRHFLAG